MVIGISGFFAVGKTSFGRFLSDFLNARFIESDKVVLALYKPQNAGYELVKSEFGVEFVDHQGVLKEKLRELVLADFSKFKLLANLVQPLVKNFIAEKIKRESERGVGNFVIEAIDFVSGGLLEIVDVMILVKARESVALKNALGRGVSQNDFRRFMQNQKLNSKCDFEVLNEGSLDQLRLEARKVALKIDKLREKF
jgi:dephospho-CoA kinase